MVQYEMARMVENWLVGFWWENLREGDCLVDLGVDGRIRLKYILRE